MKRIFKNIAVMSLCFVVLGMFSRVDAATNNNSQGVSVTIDNGSVVIPGTPSIINVDNVTTNSVNLLVEVENTFVGYANEVLDYIVTATNIFTGGVVNINYTQGNDGNAQTTLSVVGLDPGTEYDFQVRYSRPGDVFSADSIAENVVTMINAPILNSISNVTSDSADLNIVVDPAFIGDTMDFIIDISGSSSYTMQLTRGVTSSNLSLPVDNLDPNTEYTFKFKYARTGTLNFSDYSNSRSATTNQEILTDPEITNIDNITTSSVDVVVKVDDKQNENLDFVLHVKNKSNGNSFTVDFSKTTDGSGEAVLGVTGLNPGTEYEFKVKYSLDSEDGESDYSNLKSIITDSVSISDPTVEICSNDVTIIVLQSELQSYLDQGATVGACTQVEDKKIIICHNGNTISIAESAVQAHLDQGDSIGACDISGGATDVEDVENINKTHEDNKKEAVKEAIAPEESKKTYKTVAAAGVVAGATAALAGSSIPLFAAMPGAFSSTAFLQFLQLFGIIGRRKEERNWGVVFDGDTRVPIPAAKIMLLDTSGKEMATTYSDKDGRFGFLVSPGKYVINVNKKNYKLITDSSSDELYGNIYNGGEVEIDQDHVMLSNIAMKSTAIDWEEYAAKKEKQYNSKWSIFKKYFFIAIYVIGFSATVIITYFYPSIFNFIVLGIYIILFVFQTFFKKKKYGLVETSDGKPIPFAVVNLYEKDTNAKQNFAVTDSIGRYYLLADNGTYNLKAKGQPISGKQFEKSGEVKVKDGILREDIVV